MPINEYEDLAKEVFSEQPELAPSPVAAVPEVVEMADAQKQELEGSMYVAAKKNPDRQAEVLRLSEKTRLPADMIERNFDQVKASAEEPNDYAALIRENPSVSQFMSNPDNAGVAHDDMEAMKAVENTVKDHQYDSDLMNEFTVGMSRLNASISKIPALAVDLAVTPGNMFYRAIGLPEYGQAQAPDWLRKNPVSEYYDSEAKKFQTPNLDASVVTEIDKGNYRGAARAAVAQFMSNAPQQLLNVGLAMSGAGAPGLALAGATSAADANAERPEGTDPVAATMNAAYAGAIEAAFESLGTFGIMKHWEGVISKTYSREISREVMKDFAKTIVASIAGEANEEFLTSLAQDYASVATGVNPDGMKGAWGRAVEAGIVGGMSGGAMTGPGAITSGVQSSRQATREKNLYLAMGKSAEAMKLRERLPEKQREFVQQVAENGGIENVYIPVEEFETYFQKKGLTPAQIAQEIGVQKAYDEAKQSGGDIEVPMGQWVEKVVGTEHYTGLADSVKFSVDGETVAQAKVSRERAESQVKEADQAVVETTAAEEQKINEVVTQVGAMLSEAGLDAKQAPLLRGIATLAIREGMEPQDLLNSLGLQIGRGEEFNVEGGRVAAQPESGPLKRFSQAVARVFNQGQKSETPVGAPQREEFVQFLKSKGKNVVRGQLIHDGMLREVGAPQEMIDRLKEFNKPENDPARKILEPFQPRIYNQAVTLAPTFFSKLAQTVDQKMGNSATVEQINGMLKEIKPEERKWMGLDTFLAGKEKVSKAELQEFLKANALDIQEIVKGESLTREQALALAESGEMVQIVGRDGGFYEGTAEEVTEAFDGATFRTRDSRTKFGNYVLPGGENYREVLFTLPEETKAGIDGVAGLKVSQNEDGEWDVTNKDGRVLFTGTEAQEAADYIRTESEILNREKQNKGYRSSHFDEKNVLAHTRLNDRVDADGKKVLFIEEIQSDWHQDGRKKGYKGDVKFVPLTPAAITEVEDVDGRWSFYIKTNNGNTVVMNVYKEEWDSAQRKKVDAGLTVESAQELALQKVNETEKNHAEFVANQASVPDAPFRKNWHEFVMKRLIREAAEKGYDKIAWTTGEQQADRYDLSKQVDSVGAIKNKDGKWDVEAYKNGSIAHEGSNLSDSDLESQLGKDLAAKIIEGSGREEKSGYRIYEGTDLKVGGEGMKGFYDTMLVGFANKFGKKYGAKVEQTKVALENNDFGKVFLVDANEQIIGGPYDSKESAQAELDRNILPTKYGTIRDSATTVHSMTITPELRNAALNEGFSLFQRPTDETPRGQIRFGESAIRIDILEKADASTFIHETGHLYLELLGRLSQREQATQETKDDMATLLQWMGVESISDIGTDQHEMFARGFEKFLGEGKAPSKALKKVFNRFKVWIMSVYQDLGALNVNLTDDVRDIMGRMLTTETEIGKATTSLDVAPLFGDPAGVGMNEAQALKYREAQSDAQDFAKEQLLAELMKDFNRKKTKEYEARRKTVEAEVEAEVNQSPVYNAIAFLQNGTQADGSPIPEGTPHIKLDPASVTPEERKVMPRGIWDKENGMHPDIVAEILDFPSGDNMLDNIREAPKKEDLIEKITRERMTDIYPDILDDGPRMTDEAFVALHNERRGDMLELELQHLAVHNPGVVKTAIRAVSRRVTPRAEVRSQAEALISTKAVKDLRPHLYRAAERKAAKQAGEMLTKGDIDAAFSFKQLELLNYELFRASTEAKNNVNNTIKKFKKMFKSDEKVSKSRDTNLVNAARSVLAQFGLTPNTEKTAAEYLASIKAYDPEAYTVVQALVDQAAENAGPYRDVSYDDFADMADAVNALWDLSKTSKEMEIDGKRVTIEEAKAELADQMAMISSPAQKPGMLKAVSKWEKTKVTLLNARAALTRVEHWVDAMDGGHGGPFRKFIFQPVSDAVAQYRLSKESVIKEYRQILTDNKALFVKGKIDAQEIGYEFKDKAELLMALLHTGNQSNQDKLLRGRNWGTMSEDGTVDASRWEAFVKRAHETGLLTKADYDFAQQIWNLMDAQKPAAQRAHKAMFGYYFNEITARDIVTPFGTFKGGYIPAKTDVYVTEDAKIRQDQQAFEQNNNSFQFPTTGRGFTKSRVEDYAAPLSLEMSLLGSHIDGVLRFTHIEPRVKDVAKLVNDKQFRSALGGIDSAAASEMLIPWLQRAATQRVVLPGEDGVSRLLDPVASYLRSSVAMQLMVGNVVNTIEQFTGLSIALTKVDRKHMRNALVTYLSGAKKTTEMVMEKSEFMRSTQGSTIYEAQQAIEQIIENPNTFQKMQDFASKHTYFMQSATQNLVNTTVWLGAYEQAIQRGATELEAVREADASVRLTQGTNNPEDISRHEVGTPTKRLFTQFAGYFNMLANLNQAEFQKVARGIGLRKGAGRLFYIYLVALAIPAILSGALRKMAGGDDWDEDDDGYLDDTLAVLFGSQAQTLTAMVPFAGQLITAGANKFNDKQFDDRLSLSPVISVLEAAVGVPGDIYKILRDDKHLSKKNVKDVLMLMGAASSLPVGPIGRPAGYLMDVEAGKTQPTGPVDFTRGLVTGRGPR